MFLHGYLLFGLLLAGVPVALHLLLRQKPKRVVFPAFRFLLQRQQTNQRRMRLRHLLLMLLRVAVLVVLILALARPRLFGDRTGAAMDRPVVAALLFDTSPSMGYTFAGATRLDEALARGRELLDEMEPTSRVAVLDAGDPALEPLLPVAEARGRLKGVQIRPGAGSLNRAVERGLDLLARSRAETQGEGPPHLLVVFSDRTRGCWDVRGTRPAVPEGVSVLFVDVGPRTPVNLGIEAAEVVPPTVAPGGRYEVRVRLRGTAGGHENQVTCQPEGGDLERLPVKLEKDQTQAVVTFERTAPKQAGPHGLKLGLGTRDALPADDVRHATLSVRGVGKMLTLVEADADTAKVWDAAQQALGSFTNEVRDYAKGEAAALADYAVVVLCQPTRLPRWRDKLEEYVRRGGALAVIPGGVEINDAGLFPAPLASLESPKPPLFWAPFRSQHPTLMPFADPVFAREDIRPLARRYWKLGKLAAGGSTIATYENGDPALAERNVGRGRVLLFTTPLSGDGRWTNYGELDNPFGFMLIDRASRYLAREETPREMAFTCGTEPSVRVPTPLLPQYTVAGPGLAGNERNLRTPTPAGEAEVSQAKQPGNYTVADGQKNAVAGFSLDIAGAESDLEPVPREELEGLFGEKTLIEQGKAVTLRAALSSLRPPPMELMPYLLLALLAAMTVEGLFANRFYRDDAAPAEAKAA
jgi:hypothetical protein